MTKVLLFNERTEAMAKALAARCPDVTIGEVQRYGDLAAALKEMRPKSPTCDTKIMNEPL